jgi:hypothetical protein
MGNETDLLTQWLVLRQTFALVDNKMIGFSPDFLIGIFFCPFHILNQLFKFTLAAEKPVPRKLHSNGQ